MKNILVAIDFSEISNRLIEKAIPFGEKFGAKLWLVHIAAPDPDFVGFEAGPQYIRDGRAKTLRHEHQQLQSYAARLNDDGILAEALLIQGPTVKTLVEEAEKLKADLIILGAEDHGKIFEKIFGSVWEQIVKSTKVPVLLIPG